MTASTLLSTLTAERLDTADMATRLFSDEMKAGMKAFKAHPTATYFNHLTRTMLVWQQFDQLQRKPALRESLIAFLDRVPSLPMGTWGDHACIFACGMTAKELMAIADRTTQL